MFIDQVLSRQNIGTPKEENKKVNRIESARRSLAKTISWRIVGTADTILISWFITGALSFAFSIGAIELITKMVLYFFHERTWNIIDYGK